jgi:dienelactone hydrolase
MMRIPATRASWLTHCAAWACLLLAGASCSSDSSGNGGSGGHAGSGSGGAQSTGGALATGGNRSGGTSGTGGISATGGSGSGGKGSTGGSEGTGGSNAAGGVVSSGGVSATGGRGAGGGGTAGNGAGGAAGNPAGGVSGTGGRSGMDAQAGGQTTADGGAGDAGSSTGTACASTLPAVTDYTALAGPFATTTENNTGPDGKCVIYRPKTLGESGFLHAPIVFGPGIGMQASQLSGLLLSFASHGYVVIGTGVLNGGPNDPANKAAMQNALDWMLQQNDKAGTYQGKLATKCAVSMGYSVGGTAAVELGGHAAVATTVSIHGHVANSAMHGPLLQTSGDKDTVGRPMQQQTFDKSQVATAFGTVSGADHGYIQSNNGGVERPAIIAWMRYWINGDTGARSYFWGTSCVLCKSPWMDYKTKNWPP